MVNKHNTDTFICFCHLKEDKLTPCLLKKGVEIQPELQSHQSLTCQPLVTNNSKNKSKPSPQVLLHSHTSCWKERLCVNTAASAVATVTGGSLCVCVFPLKLATLHVNPVQGHVFCAAALDWFLFLQAACYQN